MLYYNSPIFMIGRFILRFSRFSFFESCRLAKGSKLVSLLGRISATFFKIPFHQSVYKRNRVSVNQGIVENLGTAELNVVRLSNWSKKDKLEVY